MNFFRESCISAVIDNSTPIGGNRIEVEIDESKFGKRKYHKGHKVEGQWVFGGREKYNKKQIFMIPVCNRKESTLIPIIKKWIEPGSIIHSDCWKAYSKCTGQQSLFPNTQNAFPIISSSVQQMPVLHTIAKKKPLLK